MVVIIDLYDPIIAAHLLSIFEVRVGAFGIVSALAVHDLAHEVLLIDGKSLFIADDAEGVASEFGRAPVVLEGGAAVGVG